MSEQPGRLGLQGKLLVFEAKEVLRGWIKVRDGTLERQVYVSKLKGKHNYIRGVLSEADKLGGKGKHGGVAREVKKHFDSLWTFLDHEGLEPTNNTAERELRHPVILRKLCYGSQSERGLRFMERALSIRGTLRRQGRNFYQFLVALWTHQPTSILPADLAPA